jgi:hypothetical protein
MQSRNRNRVPSLEQNWDTIRSDHGYRLPHSSGPYCVHFTEILSLEFNLCDRYPMNLLPAGAPELPIIGTDPSQRRISISKMMNDRIFSNQ